ncbi:endolytic transglycosylase MltG [Streptomyces sp. NPDC059816]|uniref:endolytic transglycosylase MltG n=1 Tax=Streptomyces sp. NPDC059816 TaxID=3346960 RepID=UPI003653692E
MQTETPRRRPIRLTRRGRIALVAVGAVVVGTSIAVPMALPGGQPAEPGSLTVPEGWRADQVYTAVDKALALRAGTTRKEVPTMRLALPADARGNPEGYLLPATYPVTAKTTPRSLLSSMVNNANKRFRAGPVAAGASGASTLNLYQTVTIASIIQTEADDKTDMGKVARVIHNRLEQGMPLQMDSTIDYVLNRSTSHSDNDDARVDTPYNTYTRTGLPPTPIASPGDQALRAAVAPPPGDWLYFVTVKPGDTRFTAEYEDHQRNVTEFNQNQNQSPDARSPSPTS